MCLDSEHYFGFSYRCIPGEPGPRLRRPLYIFTDNEKQLVSEFLHSLCRVSGSEHYFSTSYRPQLSKKTELRSKTTVQRLSHYVADHDTTGEQYLQLLAYFYNMQVYQITGTTSFDLVFPRHPPSTTLRKSPDGPSTPALDEHLTSIQYKWSAI